MRQGGGVLERQPVRDRLERPLRRADVLREAPLPEREEIGEDLSPGLNRVTPAPTASTTPATSMPTRGFLGARRPEEQAGEARPRPEPVEVRPVDRRRLDADEHLVLRRGRTGDVADSHDVRRAISLTDRRLHRHDRARSFRAAASAVLAIRSARVSGRRAKAIHVSIVLRADGGNAAKFDAAGGRRSRATARSSGTSSRSTESRIVHDPFALARSIAARPAGRICPSRMSRSTRALLLAAQALRVLRGAK